MEKMGQRLRMNSRVEACFLFACFFLLYALTSSGDLIGDSEKRWKVAERIVDARWFDLPSGSAPTNARGCDGKEYSVYGPGQSICLVPFVAAGRTLSVLLLPEQGADRMLGQLLASLLFFPLCGALAVVLVSAVVADMTDDRAAARWSAMIFGAATMHWHHTVNTYEESQIAVCLLVSLWAVQRAWRRNGWGYPLLACAAMGVGLCFRASSVVVSAPLGAAALCYDLTSGVGSKHKRRRVGQWIAAGVLGLGPFLLAAGAYNALRFGSPWDTGYGSTRVLRMAGVGLFDTPLLTGLSGLLISPGKSVFLFNPVLLLGICGFVPLWRTHRGLAIILAGTSFCTLIFHAKYTFWSGDLAWGPRYLASMMGIWILAIVPVLQGVRFRKSVAALVTISVCVQAASVVYNFGLEFFQDLRHGTIPDGYVWRPGESQLFCRFRNIALHASGRPDYHSIPPERQRPATRQVITTPEAVKGMHVINIFPFKARAVTGNTKTFSALLALWLAGWAALAVVVGLWRPWRTSAGTAYAKV